MGSYRQHFNHTSNFAVDEVEVENMESDAPPPPGEGGISLEELLDLPLQLFARDHLDLALVDFVGSPPGFLDPELPNFLFRKLVQAFEEDLRKVRPVLHG